MLLCFMSDSLSLFFVFEIKKKYYMEYGRQFYIIVEVQIFDSILVQICCMFQKMYIVWID